MNTPNEIIIIGGGKSIQNELASNLKSNITDKLVITCNFAFKHFNSTLTTFVDTDFYLGKLNTEKDKIIHTDHVEQIKQVPLIIGFSGQTIQTHSNTILIPANSVYSRDILKKGCYRPTLCGIFSLTLAMYLIDFKGVIYLLGYDWTRKGDTHYYTDTKHRGINYTNFYDRHNADQYFKIFLQEKDVKIYNVIGEPRSNIETFEQIAYSDFYTKLTNERYNQKELRQQIRTKLRA
jgi:hypothetical protein